MFISKFLPVFQAMDETIASQKQFNEQLFKREVSCKKGCSACCHMYVQVTLAEALYIVNYIIMEKGEKALRKVLARCHEQEKLIANKKVDRAYLLNKRVPCIFLSKEKTCEIYKVRPIPCRSYFVFSDPENCGKENAEVLRTGNDEFVIMFGEIVDKMTNKVGRLPGPFPVMITVAADVILNNKDISSTDSFKDILKKYGGTEKTYGAHWAHIYRDDDEYLLIHKAFEETLKSMPKEIQEKAKPYSNEYYMKEQEKTKKLSQGNKELQEKMTTF